MKTGTDFAKHLSKFLSEYLPFERNLSSNTIATYRDTFVQFIIFMKDVQNIKIEHLVLDKITRSVVIDFLSWLQKERNCCIATRNNRLASIHSFISYLQYEDISHLQEWQKILSIKSLRIEKKCICYLTTDGIKLLFDQPDLAEVNGRRNLALLALMYDTGARVQEIIDLTPESLKIENQPFTVRLFGKGRKSRVVPLIEGQTIILKKYMNENHLFDQYKLKHPLFFNIRKEKLTRSGVTYILKTYAIMARQINPELMPENVSCHTLRHSKAMHLLQSGVNLVFIRDLLGHVSVQTTEIYARADSKQKREALEKAYTKLIPEQASQCEWAKNQNLLEWLKSLQR
jgi:integrase/recombinase XerD